jgi:UPF0271 protein
MDPEKVATMADTWNHLRVPGLVAVVPAFNEICLHFDPCLTSPPLLLAELPVSASATTSPRRRHLLPINYHTSADRKEVVSLLGLDWEEIISLHQEPIYACRAVGFQPGFGYFGDLPSPLNQIPRKSSPAVRVVPGTVAIASGMTGIYPTASPGGWWSLGTTSSVIFNLEALSFLFRVGDELQFVEVSPESQPESLTDFPIQIDLNCDLGEGVGPERELLKWITTANIACGAHAGSKELSREIAKEALDQGVSVVAHPGYPDRDNFGRRTYSDLALTVTKWQESLARQLDLLPEAKAIKPHGALYHDLNDKAGPIEVFIRELAQRNLPLIGMGQAHREIAQHAGVPFVLEGFAERGYTEDGLLMPRSQPGALLTTEPEIQRQVERLLPLVQTICLHSDSPNSLEKLHMIRRSLGMRGVTLVSPL